MKAPKLEGPKIIGKIELPVNTVGGKQERKEKRKRKRIPVDKKPETNNKQGGNTAGGTQQGQGNRNNNANRPGAKPNDAPRAVYNRPGNNQAGGNRNNNTRGPINRAGGNMGNNDQEIDAKAIQDKIRETQAKLAGGGARNKNLKAKYRRNKREEMAEKRAAAEQANDGEA